jgi:hypothetical protein
MDPAALILPPEAGAVLADRAELPEVRMVRQTVASPSIDDVRGAVRSAMSARLEAYDGPLGPIAVGVGSRGIASLHTIVRVTVEELRRAGFEPFIVPAMGSHGGATPEGQRQLLADYGITEEGVGAEIRATMETVSIGEVDGFDVVVDRYVVDAGRAFLINRVKPHTDFQGEIESGIAKMAAVGIAKQSGAQRMHRLGPESGLRDLIPKVGRFVSDRLLLGGLAIVENRFDKTMLIEALGPKDIGSGRESELLEIARAELPRIPFADLDLIVIERMGKNISGTAVDPNVIGRRLVIGAPELYPPLTRGIVALDLTPESHGNALGIGLVDFVPSRLIEAVDPAKTFVNGVTSGWLCFERLKLPIVLSTDREAIEVAAAICERDHGDGRIVWIEDTLHTTVLAVSRALWDEADADPDLEAVSDPFAPSFDADGRLVRLSEIGEKIRN